MGEEDKVAGEETVAAVDETGVPYLNRYKEEERKRLKAEQERDEIKAKLEGTPHTEPVIEEDDWTKQQREIAKQEYKRETDATETMRGILDKLEKNPYIKKYRSTIESRLRGMSSDLRSNPHSVELIANSVIGANYDDIIKDVKPKTVEQREDNNRRLVSEVLTPTPNVNGHSKVELSDDEISFGEQHRLFDKNFTDDEIREMYKKRQSKLAVAK